MPSAKRDTPAVKIDLGIFLEKKKQVMGSRYKAPAELESIDPYEFIFKHTYTLDPHDAINPVKNMPDTPYIREMIGIWLESDNLLVVKSRQMKITWLLVALNLWLAMTQNGQYIFFISKKEDDAGYSSQLSLLSRAKFIYDKLPKAMQIGFKKSAAPSMLMFPGNNSTIHGVSQDSDATRQYTASSIMFDEMAFMEHAEACYSSIKPTIDGPRQRLAVMAADSERTLVLPKFTGVSTPNGKRNLFAALVHDQLALK